MPIKKNALILFCLLLALSYCKQPEAKQEVTEKKKEKDKTEKKQSAAESYSSPPGYDLNKPVIFNLKSELDEISGLVYYPKDTSVFAISDENGWLYKIHFTGKMQVEKWKFSKGQDFEDLVLLDSTFYALESSGKIIAFKFVNTAPSVSNTYGLQKGGKNEFEILYLDSAAGKLVMICKDCEEDPKAKVSAFSFDPSTTSFSTFYSLDANEIAEKLGLSKVKFKPSAACINPLTKELFIISSVNKALVITDNNGNIKSVYNLNPKIYKQPEGITFTPAGDLLISNEGADIGPANVLIFKLKK